jgi:hypothetical protein
MKAGKWSVAGALPFPTFPEPMAVSRDRVGESLVASGFFPASIENACFISKIGR